MERKRIRVVCPSKGRSGNVKTLKLIPDLPGQHGGAHRAVAVQDVETLLPHPPHQLRGEGDPRPVAQLFGQRQAGVAIDGKGIGGVVGVRIIGRHHGGLAVLVVDDPGVVFHRVGHPVDDGGKRVVDQADVQIVHELPPK